MNNPLNRIKSPRDKYLQDPQFKALVDMMTAHIHMCEFTPSEMREAAMVASIICEENRTRYSLINEKAERAFATLAKIETEES